jgi:hypothetical protein
MKTVFCFNGIALCNYFKRCIVWVLAELFAITETEWKSERAIASLVAANHCNEIHVLVDVIMPTITEKK